jgi:type I restriction enzyme S subunit
MKNIPTNGHLAEDVYLREMASGTKFINGDTLLARITPCLENGKTAYVDFLEKDQVGWGSTEYIVMRPKDNRPLSLGYIIARLDSFRSKAIQTMTGTSGRQRANAKAISELIWVDYPLELLTTFDQISGSFLTKAKVNGDQSKALSHIRDTLLPKLLSGELSLDKAV